MLLGVLSVVDPSRGWKGRFSEGMWWYRPCYPCGLGTWGRMGWGRSWHPQHGTIPCRPTAEMPPVPTFPPCPHDPPARPTVPPQHTPSHSTRLGAQRCLLPQLSSGMPGLWFQGIQLTSPHRQWPGTAVTSSPLSQESHHTPLPLPVTLLHRGRKDLNPEEGIIPQADVVGLACPFPTLYSGGSHCHGRDRMCWQGGTPFP